MLCVCCTCMNVCTHHDMDAHNYTVDNPIMIQLLSSFNSSLLQTHSLPNDVCVTMCTCRYVCVTMCTCRYMVRNSMGACTMVRMGRGGRGRGSRGFFPMQMFQPNQRLVVPPAQLQPSFYPTSCEQILSNVSHVHLLHTDTMCM